MIESCSMVLGQSAATSVVLAVSRVLLGRLLSRITGAAHGAGGCFRGKAAFYGEPTMEPTMAGKWLELLKEIAPRIVRVAMLFNPVSATWPYCDAG
jgi:hypothetical protein